MQNYRRTIFSWSLVVYGDSSVIIWGGQWGATGSHVTGSDDSHMTGTGSMLCACATGNGAISILLGPFHRKWVSHVTETVRKRPWPEVCSAHARIFTSSFFLSSSTKCNTVVQVPWLPEVTKGHVIPSEFPWCAISALVGPFDRKWRHP
jgi:hypothetical protein